MSLTIQGLYALLIALGIDIFKPDEMQLVYDSFVVAVQATLTIVGVVTIWVGRVRLGDIKFWGGRK